MSFSETIIEKCSDFIHSYVIYGFSFPRQRRCCGERKGRQFLMKNSTNGFHYCFTPFWNKQTKTRWILTIVQTSLARFKKLLAAKISVLQLLGSDFQLFVCARSLFALTVIGNICKHIFLHTVESAYIQINQLSNGKSMFRRLSKYNIILRKLVAPPQKKKKKKRS